MQSQTWWRSPLVPRRGPLMLLQQETPSSWTALGIYGCTWHSLCVLLILSSCIKKKFLGILFGFMITILRVTIRRKTAMAEINNIQDIRNVRWFFFVYLPKKMPLKMGALKCEAFTEENWSLTHGKSPAMTICGVISTQSKTDVKL